MDPELKYEVAARPGAENITACFSCGTCTAGCPVCEIEPRFNPRKLVCMILWGMREELLSSDLIWLCNRCYRCYSHCPQDVRFTDVIAVLREMAVEEGYVDATMLDTVRGIDTVVQQIRHDLVTFLVRSGDGVISRDELDTGEIVRNLVDRGAKGVRTRDR